MASQSLFASVHQLRIECEQDVLDIIAIEAPGLIFRVDDVSAEFFDLSSGLAGSVFQKLINYRKRAVFVLPVDHHLGERVTELAREYCDHPYVRIMPSEAMALDWLESLQPPHSLINGATKLDT